MFVFRAPDGAKESFAPWRGLFHMLRPCPMACAMGHILPPVG